MLKLYNTRTKQLEHFHPRHGKTVSLYTCGPTVYHYAHIGNLRTYVFEDILRRTLKLNRYEITHVMNITDVGHLTDDADQGEDKMEAGARREGKSAWEIAKMYTEAFQNNLRELNILEPTIWCRATDHIEEQIALVQKLTDTDHTYQTSDGIYFDTKTFPAYGELAGLKQTDIQPGIRVEMGEKRHPHDFALWKFSRPEEKRQMEWEAFGRMGFPGWHIECSAMALKYLGEEIDIHCGGVDHISIHHTNEIAQVEAVIATHPWVNIWMHGEFLLVDDGKMAKSADNFLTLEELKHKGYSALSYRFLLLQTHYRKQMNFSFEALAAAEKGLNHLRSAIAHVTPNNPGDPHLMHEFNEALNDDLNTPEALAVLWSGLKRDGLSLDMIIACDKVLGLSLKTDPQEQSPIPEAIDLLVKKREKARDEKNWAESDRLREEIQQAGFLVEDTAEGPRLSKQTERL